MTSSSQTSFVSTSNATRSTRNSNASNLDGKASQEKRPAKRGFAAMDPARQREIAAQGGRAAHESGNAHQFTSEEARAAGKKSHSGRSRAANTADQRSNTELRAAAGKSVRSTLRPSSDGGAAAANH